jgi:hypothetical protein
MRVGDLIEELKNYEPDERVRLGMFYGPGSPSLQAYEITEIRKTGLIVYVLAEDMNRKARLSAPSGMVQEAQTRIEGAARQLRELARGMDEWVGGE